MLDFAANTKDQTIIDNINVLVHVWQPAASTMSRVSSNNGLIIINDSDKLDFQNDLMALTIQCEDFNAFIKRRAAELKAAPFITNLQTYYALGQRYQGLLTMAANINTIIFDKCYNFLAHIQTSSEKRSQVENEVIKRISELLVDEFRKTDHLLLEITASRQIALTEILDNYGNPISENGNIQQVSEGYNLINRWILMGEFQRGQTIIQIKAQLQAHFSSSFPPQMPAFSNVTNFLFKINDSVIPIIMSMYPLFDADVQKKPITLSQFRLGPNGAHAAVKAQALPNISGNLMYQPPQLAVTLSNHFTQPNYATKLPLYFQAMVEIAKNHHCYQIVLYTPFNFADIAFAFGFHPKEREKVTSSQARVEKQLSQKKAVQLLPDNTNQYVNQQVLMQPLYFPLGEIATRKVYFTEKGESTTYARLIDKLAFFNKHTTNNTILPDPYGLMARPFSLGMRALQMRELTGKGFKRDVARFQTEIIDANRLQNDKALAELGEGCFTKSTDPKQMTRIFK